MLEKVRILLIEDDPKVALRTEALIFSLGYDLLKTVDNSEDAIHVIRQQNPDILVMDIDIKGKLNGIEVAEQVSVLQIPIVFVTGHNEQKYYDLAKQVQPVAYLVKPFNKFTFQSALENAVIGLSKNENLHSPESKKDASEEWIGEVWLKKSFFIKRNNLLQKVKIEDIHYIQSDGNYCDIITNKKFAVKTSLVQLLRRLPANQFVRIHKSYIIQADLIENIDMTSNEVYIGGATIPLGPKYREDILKIVDRL